MSGFPSTRPSVDKARASRNSFFSERASSSISTREHSPYRELYRFEPKLEEPLIQLSPSLTPKWSTTQVTASTREPRLAQQPSLLDLDDVQELNVASRETSNDSIEQQPDHNKPELDIWLRQAQNRLRQEQLDADLELAKRLQAEERNALGPTSVTEAPCNISIEIPYLPVLSGPIIGLHYLASLPSPHP